MRITLSILSLLLMVSCSEKQAENLNEKPKLERPLTESTKPFKHFHTFTSNKGVVIGKAFALFKDSQEVFTSMVIVNKINEIPDTLYVVDNNRLYSNKRLEEEVAKEAFFGYKSVLNKNDNIVLVLTDENGREVSDNLTIKWNYKDGLFEILRTP